MVKQKELSRRNGKSVVGANIRGNLAEKKGEGTFLKERMHKRTPGDQNHQEKSQWPWKRWPVQKKVGPNPLELGMSGGKSECEVGKLRRVVEDWIRLSGASGKEPSCQCRRCKRCQFHPWVGKIPWRRKSQPTPVCLPGKPHGQRSLVGYRLQGCKEIDMTEATEPACTAGHNF